mgnify:CR=1 FL=1
MDAEPLETQLREGVEHRGLGAGGPDGGEQWRPPVSRARRSKQRTPGPRRARVFVFFGQGPLPPLTCDSGIGGHSQQREDPAPWRHQLKLSRRTLRTIVYFPEMHCYACSPQEVPYGTYGTEVYRSTTSKKVGGTGTTQFGFRVGRRVPR